MMMKPLDRLSRSKKGQMPFAMIAVAILLIGTAYGVICANVQNSEDQAESLIDEYNSMDDAIDDNERRIESGLGTIICKLSSAENGGTLVQRIESFDTLSEEWFVENYPFCNRGVTATIVSHDLDLNVESMKLSSGDVITDSSEASFLRCEGTVTVHLINSTGESESTLDICADGTSCLPFIATSSSEFELSASGGSSILTQLMSYQLSALAQSRVTNGYGAFSVDGEYGLNKVITKADVNEAFRNSLSIVETMCFRSNGEDDMTLVNSDNVDAAELIVLKDGYFEIDMSAIVAQVLSSMFDSMFTKWIDFALGDSFLQIADEVGDEVLKLLYSIVDVCKQIPGVKQLYDLSTSLCSWIEDLFGSSDEETDSAVRYIRDAMEDAGYSEDQYRYITYGSAYHFDGGEFHYELLKEDHTVTLDADDFIVVFCTDVFEWDGWSGYLSDYLDNTNVIAESIKNILNSIFVKIADEYGVYRISADSFDDKDFLEDYKESLKTAISKGLNNEEYYIQSGLDTETVCDPFYSSIYNMMVDHKDEIFTGNNDRDIQKIIETYYERHKNLDCLLAISNNSDTILEMMVCTDSSVYFEYDSSVSALLALFDGVLNSVENDNSDALESLIATAGKKVIDIDLISDAIESYAYGLVEDTIDNISLSTTSGIQKLDGLSSYYLYDYDGNVREEFVDVTDRYDLDVTITTPADNTSKNIHAVNPEELSYMPFTSVFTVSASTVVDYTVSSASSVDMALGRNDACVSGSFIVDTTFDVTCVSGWELAGVDYSPSTNLGEYLWSKLLEFADSLIEPLTSIFKSIRNIYNVTSTAMLEIQDKLNDVIMAIYDAITSPIVMLQDLIESGIMDFLTNVIEEFDIGLGKQMVKLNYFGFEITLELYTSTYMSKTMKHVMKMSIEGKIGDADCSAYLDIKQNAKKEVLIKGGAEIDLDDFCIDVDIDPMLKFGKRIVSANGSVRDINFDIALPERQLYDEVEFRLSDVCPAISNIPIVPGIKASIDVGAELKFKLPFGTGLMINEFESNPEGKDNDNEWVEIYNATASTIDLTGYAVVPKSNESKALMLEGTIAPFEHKVFYFDGQCLINERSGKNNGESLSLIDPEGTVVDKTPAKKDAYNDGRTWQRKSDGDSTWVFNYATEGTSNGTAFNINSIVKTFFIDTLKSAAEQAFCDMGNHLTTMDEVSEFLQHMLKLYIEKIIDKISSMLIGASIFIELEIQDDAELLHKGVRLAFEIGEDLVEEGLHWLLRQIPLLCEFVQKPSTDDPVQIICENSYVTLSTYFSAGAPEFLKLSDLQAKYVVKTGVNLCGITEVFGNDTGKWKVYAGVILEGIDPKLLPAGLKSNQDLECDLWLIKMEISE